MTDTVITGASGFIGSHLMKKIEAKALKHQDIVIGHSYNARKMFFLSTYGNMAHHTDIRTIAQANVYDVISVLDRFYLGEWFCYMSSSSVLLPVQTSYSRTKRAAEEIIQAFTDIKSCIVRPYSVTGVGEQREHLIPTLIRSCMEGEIIDFSPWPVHDFVDVEDVVDGLIYLSNHQHTAIFEFGNGIAYTNHQVLKLVEKVCGRKAAGLREVSDLRKYDTYDWCSDASPHWFKPKKTLEQSITEMVEAYKYEHNIPVVIGRREDGSWY